MKNDVADEAEIAQLLNDLSQLGTSKEESVSIGDGSIAIEALVKGTQVKLIGNADSQVEDDLVTCSALFKKLREELQLLYYVNHYGEIINALYEKKSAKEIKITKRVENSKLKDLLELRLQVVWLIKELKEQKASLLRVIREKSIDLTRPQIIIENCCDRWKSTVSSRPPLVRPLVDHCQIDYLGYPDCVKLRDLVFREVDLTSIPRLQISSVLSIDDYTTLLASPVDTFHSLIQYVQMTHQEFIDFCYSVYSPDYSIKTAQQKCPCGRYAGIVKNFDRKITLHDTDCTFQRYLRQHVPNLINLEDSNKIDEADPSNGILVLTEKESDYIRGIVESGKY